MAMTCIVDPPTALLNPKRNERNKNKCKLFQNLPKKMKNVKEIRKTKLLPGGNSERSPMEAEDVMCK
jgi:hypothetical protein